ncbi:MAG: hypothetical protein WC807_18275 [Hyphomicrobium sp.]|jgi:hypothetical protein
MILNLDEPAAWPKPLAEYLDQNHDLFLSWERQGEGTPGRKVSGFEYDQAIYGLRAVMRPYSLIGLHCTRLTDREIDHILAEGMQLPSGEMLARRVNDLLVAGEVTETIAARLIAENQADESGRTGMVWFCFFRPGIAGESGIGSFFQFWGGEALYNSHDGDPDTGAVLERVGVPCLIEAEVPIASLEPAGGLDFKIIRRYLIHRGFRTREPVDHEDRIKKPLPAHCIRRVIRHPDSEFRELTGCESWDAPLRP